MRYLTLGVVIGATLLAGVASAADMPAKAVKGKVVPVVVPFSWTGFYIGPNIGYGWASVDGRVTTTGGTIGTTSNATSTDLNGVNGGGQLGYNWQSGNLVFGLEGDIQASGQDARATVGCGAGCSITERDSIDWFGTARGRLGWAMDRTLIYATAGAAWTKVATKVTATNAGATATVINTSDTKTGLAIGGGVEWMAWDRWSAKVEYLHISTDDVTLNAAIPAALGGGSLTFRGDADNNVVRFGLNTHF